MPDASAASTLSVNRLKVRSPSNEVGGSPNLHALWDRAPGANASASLFKEALAVAPSVGGPQQWPTLWASESLLAAQAAFKGLSPGPQGDKGWTVDLPRGYVDRMDAIKRRQLALGGRHMAELLNALQP